jgi:hypothetical protein
MITSIGSQNYWVFGLFQSSGVLGHSEVTAMEPPHRLRKAEVKYIGGKGTSILKQNILCIVFKFKRVNHKYDA